VFPYVYQAYLYCRIDLHAGGAAVLMINLLCNTILLQNNIAILILVLKCIVLTLLHFTISFTDFRISVRILVTYITVFSCSKIRLIQQVHANRIQTDYVIYMFDAANFQLGGWNFSQNGFYYMYSWRLNINQKISLKYPFVFSFCDFFFISAREKCTRFSCKSSCVRSLQ
jgi:hypothetical protein